MAAISGAALLQLLHHPAAAGDSGLITDRRLIGIPALDTSRYPASGESMVDPITAMTVTRVADKSELTGDYGRSQSKLSAIVYSRYSPANTTGEYVLVHGDNSTSAWIYRVADNRMMTILRFKPSLGSASRALGEVNELRWDYSGQHPYRLYFVGRSIARSQGNGENVGMSFYSVDFDPASGSHANPVLVRDFSADFPGFANAEIMNDVEGDSSNDSRHWAWQVMDTSRSSGFLPYAVFSYDKRSNTVLGRLQRSCTGAPAPCRTLDTPATAAPYFTRPNMVEMSPLGTRVIVHFERAYAGNNKPDTGTVADGPKGFLPDFSDPIRISVDATHSGWAWGPGGEEMFVYQNNRNDLIEVVDIRDAQTAKCRLISGNSYGCGTAVARVADIDPGYELGFHFGKVYDRNKRAWVYMNTYGNGKPAWAKNQSLLIRIGTGAPQRPQIVRLGPTYNIAYDYRSEGSGALDFKAEHVWTTANWGYKDGRGDVFKIRLPAGLFTP